MGSEEVRKGTKAECFYSLWEKKRGELYSGKREGQGRSLRRGVKWSYRRERVNAV